MVDRKWVDFTNLLSYLWENMVPTIDSYLIKLFTESAPLGRFSHRVAMSVCLSVCVSVCLSAPSGAVFSEACHWPWDHMISSPPWEMLQMVKVFCLIRDCLMPKSLSNLGYWTIFTNSAPLDRVGHRVAMSVCVSVCAIGCSFHQLGPTGPSWS